MTKQCGKCKEIKTTEQFSKSARRSDGLQTWCKECNSEHKREWIKENRDKVSKNSLWTKYRLRPEQFDALIAEQEGKCGVCKELFVQTPRVDHDHSCCSGKTSCGSCIRGLLCDNCNRLVGWYEAMHNPEKVRNIVQYLMVP